MPRADTIYAQAILLSNKNRKLFVQFQEPNIYCPTLTELSHDLKWVILLYSRYNVLSSPVERRVRYPLRFTHKRRPRQVQLTRFQFKSVSKERSSITNLITHNRAGSLVDSNSTSQQSPFRS